MYHSISSHMLSCHLINTTAVWGRLISRLALYKLVYNDIWCLSLHSNVTLLNIFNPYYLSYSCVHPHFMCCGKQTLSDCFVTTPYVIPSLPCMLNHSCTPGIGYMWGWNMWIVSDVTKLNVPGILNMKEKFHFVSHKSSRVTNWWVRVVDLHQRMAGASVSHAYLTNQPTTYNEDPNCTTTLP